MEIPDKVFEVAKSRGDLLSKLFEAKINANIYLEFARRFKLQTKILNPAINNRSFSPGGYFMVEFDSNETIFFVIVQKIKIKPVGQPE